MGFYLKHFRAIAKHAAAYADEQTLPDFYAIFQNSEQKMRTGMDLEPQKSKSFKEKVKSPAGLWVFRFALLILLYSGIFVAKYLVLESKMIDVYNLSQIVKDICTFQLYTGATLHSVALAMPHVSLSNSTLNPLANLTDAYTSGLASMDRKALSLEVLPIVTTGPLLGSLLASFYTSNGCTFVGNTTTQCNNSLVNNLMGNGIPGLVAIIQKTLRSSVVFFGSNTTIAQTIWSSNTSSSAVLLKEIAQIYYVLFP